MKRDFFIDFSRSFGILLALFLHFLSRVASEFNLLQLKTVWDILHFAIPILIFISGCTFSLKLAKYAKNFNFLEFFKKRILRIYAVYLFFLLITLGFDIGRSFVGETKGSVVGELIYFLKKLFLIPPNGNYFFRIILFCYILIAIILYIKSKNINLKYFIPPYLLIAAIVSTYYYIPRESVPIGSSVAVYSIFSFVEVLRWSFFFLAGLFYYPVYKKHKNILYSILSLAAFALLFKFNQFDTRIIWNNKFPPTLIYFAYSFIFIFLILYLKDAIIKTFKVFEKPIVFFSTYTLDFFLLGEFSAFLLVYIFSYLNLNMIVAFVLYFPLLLLSAYVLIKIRLWVYGFIAEMFKRFKNKL